jgi:hypothetical protein
MSQQGEGDDTPAPQPQAGGLPVGRVWSTIPKIHISEEALRQIRSDKLPKPSKRGPHFDHKKPSHLNRFLDEMEALFIRAEVTLDEAKIHAALNQMEYETQARHEREARAAKGSWRSFKSKLRKQYPESVDTGRGSLKKLNRLLEEHSPIEIHEQDKFSAFLRDFTIEMEKLMAEPAILSDTVARDKFQSALSEDFGEKLIKFLPELPSDSEDSDESDSEDEEADGEAKVKKRRKEDPYDLEDVIKAARKAVKNYAAATNTRRRYKTGIQPTESKTVAETKVRSSNPSFKVEPPEQDEFIQKMAGAVDANQVRMREIQEKVSETTNQVARLVKLMSTMDRTSGGNTAGNNSGGYAKSYTNAPKPTAPTNQASTGTSDNRRCYYCGQTGHQILECPLQKEHFAKNWIVHEEGGGTGIRYRDGSFVPRTQAGNPETRGQIVERTAKARGWEPPKALFQTAEENELAYGSPEDEDEGPTTMVQQFSSIISTMEKRQNEQLEAMEKARKEETEAILARLEAMSGNDEFQ